jgi:type I restriction enzyme S subunit
MPARCLSINPLAFTRPGSEITDRLDVHFNEPKWDNFEDELDFVCKKHGFTSLEKAVTTFNVGLTTAATAFYREDGVLFLRGENVFEEGLSLESTIYVPEEKHIEWRSSQVFPGNIVINLVGNIGDACLLPEEIPAAQINRALGRIICNHEVAPAKYVLEFINSRLGKWQLIRHSQGGMQRRFNHPDARYVKFPIIRDPSMLELLLQRLGQVKRLHESLIEKTSSIRRKNIETIGKHVDALFARELGLPTFIRRSKALFFTIPADSTCRIDVPANHPDYTRLVDQIKTASNSGALSDLAEESEDRFDPDEHIGQEIHYLAIGDIDGVSGSIIEPQKMLAEDLPSRARRLIHSGNILVGIAGASTGTENMVVFPVTREQEGWVATTGFLVLRPRDGVDIHYVCSLLKAPFVLRQIRALLTSPAMPTISDTDFMQIAVPVTNSDARETTLIEINRVLKEQRQLTIQLEQISEQIEQLLSEAKSNIFDLLDDDKFSAISARAMCIESAMGKIEEALQ